MSACARSTSSAPGCARALWVLDAGDCDDANPALNARVGCAPAMDAGVVDLGVDAGVMDLGVDAAIDAGLPFGLATYIKASNTGAGDEFGRVVALSADGITLAITALYEDSAAIGVDGDQNNNAAMDAGAVYVFRRSAGVWAQEAYIKASNSDAGDEFGRAIALSADGSMLAVGAWEEDSAASGIGGDQTSDTSNDSGAVYLFRRISGRWSQEAYVKASNSDSSTYFGYSVALSADGSALAVGAHYEDSAATGIAGDPTSGTAGNSGAVYVFRSTAGVWSQEAYVKASNTGTGDEFGGSVALSADGSTLVVSAVYEDSAATGLGGDQTNNAARDSGAVYVFRRTVGVWGQEAYVKASNTGGTDGFGWSLAISSDGLVLAVSAHWEDSAARGIGGDEASNAVRDSGSVYVFRRVAGTWTQEVYVKASNADTDDVFGRSITLSADGSVLAVGAYWEDSAATGLGGDQTNNTAMDSGAAYVFRRSAGRWAQHAYVKASNTGPVDEFGTSVALSADGATLAVGAPWEHSAAIGIGGDQTNNAAAYAGAVYAY